MAARPRTADVSSEAHSFSELLLPDYLIAGLDAAGFHKPSPVQQAAIPMGRIGSDLVVQAKSGTGKTVVFGVICVENINLEVAMPQALVLAPTREIALQSAEVIHKLAAGLAGLSVGVFIGGIPVEEDQKLLRRACHIAVGTPGRICNLLEIGALKPNYLRMLVLDEADSLMSDSFRADVQWLHAVLPKRKQVMAFSATYDPQLLRQIEGMMRKPHRVMLCEETVSLVGVRQFYALVAGDGAARPADVLQAKADGLLKLFASVTFHQAVVFCNQKADAQRLADMLTAAGYPAAFISGSKSQLDRMDTISAVRGFKLRVIVSTDLVARGVDLERVNVVANLDLPPSGATYMHRVGRTGRFGTHGIAVTFVDAAELPTLHSYLRDIAGGQVEPLPDIIPEECYAYQLQSLEDQAAFQQLLQASPAHSAAPFSTSASATGGGTQGDVLDPAQTQPLQLPGGQGAAHNARVNPPAPDASRGEHAEPAERVHPAAAAPCSGICEGQQLPPSVLHIRTSASPSPGTSSTAASCGPGTSPTLRADRSAASAVLPQRTAAAQHAAEAPTRPESRAEGTAEPLQSPASSAQLNAADSSAGADQHGPPPPPPPSPPPSAPHSTDEGQPRSAWGPAFNGVKSFSLWPDAHSSWPAVNPPWSRPAGNPASSQAAPRHADACPPTAGGPVTLPASQQAAATAAATPQASSGRADMAGRSGGASAQPDAATRPDAGVLESDQQPSADTDVGAKFASVEALPPGPACTAAPGVPETPGAAVEARFVMGQAAGAPTEELSGADDVIVTTYRRAIATYQSASLRDSAQDSSGAETEAQLAAGLAEDSAQSRQKRHAAVMAHAVAAARAAAARQQALTQRPGSAQLPENILASNYPVAAAARARATAGRTGAAEGHSGSGAWFKEQQGGSGGAIPKAAQFNALPGDEEAPGSEWSDDASMRSMHRGGSESALKPSTPVGHPLPRAAMAARSAAQGGGAGSSATWDTAASAAYGQQPERGTAARAGRGAKPPLPQGDLGDSALERAIQAIHYAAQDAADPEPEGAGDGFEGVQAEYDNGEAAGGGSAGWPSEAAAAPLDQTNPEQDPAWGQDHHGAAGGQQSADQFSAGDYSSYPIPPPPLPYQGWQVYEADGRPYYGYASASTWSQEHVASVGQGVQSYTGAEQHAWPGNVTASASASGTEVEPDPEAQGQHQAQPEGQDQAQSARAALPAEADQAGVREAYLWVPAALVRRYEQLEWDDYMQRYQQWEVACQSYYGHHGYGGQSQGMQAGVADATATSVTMAMFD